MPEGFTPTNSFVQNINLTESFYMRKQKGEEDVALLVVHTLL